jgi:hypothetical protein
VTTRRIWAAACAALLVGTPAVAGAATVTAESGRREHIQAAVDRARPGDTVAVPAGRFDFTGRVFAPDGIHIRGAGKDETVLVKRDDLGEWEAMVTVDCKTGRPFSFSGMTLAGTGREQATTSDGKDGEVRDMGLYLTGRCRDFRVFDSKFAGFARAGVTVRGNRGSVTGYPTGVIYDNDFVDTWYRWLGYGIEVAGPDSPRLPVQLGTGDAVFIEDNYFRAVRHAVASNNNARYVFRYNRIENQAARSHAIDAHGKRGWPRGSLSYEIYGNLLVNIDGQPRHATCIGIRGGDGVIFDNECVNTGAGVWFDMGADDGDYTEQAWVWDNRYKRGGDREWRTEVENRDGKIAKGDEIILERKPGYAPYPYPHPLRRER